LSANAFRSDNRLFSELQSLHTDLSKLQQNIHHYSARTDIPGEISNSIQAVHNNYTTHYIKSLDQLGVNANRELQAIAVTGQKKGMRRLIVDSTLMIACLITAFFSLKLTRAIQHIAYHDNLTNLANRYHFESALETAVDIAHHSNKQCSVLLIDLDRFKSINDTYGHNIGDELLKTISHRIQTQCEQRGMPARLGGDEFAVLFSHTESLQETIDSAQKLISCIEKEVEVNGVKLTVGSSIGISVFPDNGKNATELLKSADIAMYNAKTAGNESICLYDESMLSSYEQRIQTELDLQVAIRKQQFELHYQPQIRMASGRVTGVEALIRWNHPERGLVSPAEFIPIAEEAGMLVELGSWVLDEACNQLAQLHRRVFQIWEWLSTFPRSNLIR